MKGYQFKIALVSISLHSDVLFETSEQYGTRDFTAPNLHFSFAPVRNSAQAIWFVDGSSYMCAVANALEEATTEIYIADWWLSPEIYMKRPAIDGDYWRLDKILHRKATEGVKIFVMLYKEVEMALGINSYYSKQILNSHENIKVMRHPDHARVGVFFWAHHEKIVVVDQMYAFLGGIDLCYGRWDDFRHRLTDLGSISTSSVSGSLPKKEDDSAFESRKSHRNVNIDMQEHEKDIVLEALNPGDKIVVQVYGMSGEPLEETLKQNTPELERKNVLEKIKESAVKKGKELVNRLALAEGAEKTLSKGQKTPDITVKNLVFSPNELNEGEKGRFDDYTPFETKIFGEYYGNAKFWYGKDYSNFIMKDFVNLDAPFVDLVDRTTTPRMPWHDIGIMVIESSARDVARHFIQRWNAQKLEKVRENNSFPYLIPMSYSHFKVNPSLLKSKLNNVTCQILRSVSSWSCGFIEPDLVEQSIHDAYIQTITKAQHYVYIENQFFITMQLGVSGANNVKNQIGEALFKRIVRAKKEQKTFRVIVVIPLLPGFEGDVGGSTGIAVRALTHWNYASISRGRASILTRLKEVGVDNAHEYISFHSLRTHSQLNNIPITELIYVHSKLLIADDRVVICGSANINDRSMIGKRDSEIAAIITDNEFEDGRMNGQQLPSGIFAGRLRKYLFKEHLGLLEPNADRMLIDVSDPVIDQFYNGIWRRTSKRNTDIYDTVFKCVPNNLVKSFSSFKKYNEQPALCKTDPETATAMVKNIQGFLVDLPTDFLCEETLTPPNTSREGIIPTAVWT
ncbi:phospholipase D2 isoform X2 [Episyrphus balteatus]|uniref:phospholipase D2 isoform X2 n=1 Tax=Episyrphus balteatus TaxID=286459 RepID=UPI00248664D1|nr:phospholipase D2 isoform X2 [Episyrphus balteatus]